MISEESILDLVERNRDDMNAALRALVKAANRGGGEDNITVIAFEVTDAPVHDERTLEQALPDEPTVVLDDEDTLDETDGVPTVGDTRVISVEQVREEAEAERQARRRRLRRRLVAWLVLLLFAVAIAALVIWRLVT
jgi:hypothetical protein